MFLINHYNKAYFQIKLKIAKVIPVFKSGEESYINNYRPMKVVNIANAMIKLQFKTAIPKFIQILALKIPYVFPSINDSERHVSGWHKVDAICKKISLE